MSQVIFKDPVVSSGPTRTGTGTGSVSIDRLTHFTVAQTYTLTCIAKSPDTLFSVAGSEDGQVGIAVVGTQFFDQDLKIFLTIVQGPTAFEIGDQFVFTVVNGTDLNQNNIDTYDELPQKNFGAGLRGTERGDHTLRFSTTAQDASKFIQALKYIAKTGGAAGNAITVAYQNTVPAVDATLVEQDLTYSAATPGAGGNSLTLAYQQYTPAAFARVTIQNIQYQGLIAGTAANSYQIQYITGGTAGSEVVLVLGNVIQVKIQSGVSTATQISTAVAANSTAASMVTTSIRPDGTHSGDVQTAPVSATNLTGGAAAIGAAGAEIVSVTGSAITVTLQSGVSTATQVKAAIDASTPARALVSVAISGTPTTGQTTFVGTASFTGGVDQVGSAGSEVVSVSSNAITVTLASGASTATQVKAAVDASSAASALVTCSIVGDASSVQYAPRSAEALTGGKAKYFAFNHDEFSDSANFAEGNASIHASDATIDGKISIGGHAHLTDVLSLADSDSVNGSGHAVTNVQKIINNLFQLRKLQLDFASNGTYLWTGIQLSFTQNMELLFTDTGVKNRVLISQSPFTFNDGDSLYVNLYAPAAADLTAATGTTVPDTFPAMRLATRVGNKLYWYNGTVSYPNDVGRMGEGGNLRQQVMTLLVDGGTISVPDAGGSIAWSSALNLKLLGSSAVITIAAGSATLNDDDVAYLQLDDPMVTATKTLTVVPRSTADLSRTDRIWIFHRSINRIYLHGGDTIAPGEETTIGDGLSNDTLTYIGAPTTTSNSPTYTTANGGSTANRHITDGDNLTKAIKKTDTALGAHEDLVSGVHGVTGHVVGTTDSQTLSNKALIDNSTVIVDVTDATKRIGFDAAGSTGTTTTIATAATANRIVTLPDATTTLVGIDTAQTLTNKKLDDSTTTINDTSDPTKQIKFDAAGTTGTTQTIAGAQTANRTFTLPDATTTGVGTDVTQTLTNKTIGDAMTVAQIATPANPAAGFEKIYAKVDGNFYSLNSAGVETLIGTGTGGSSSGGTGDDLGSLLYIADASDPFSVAAGAAGSTLNATGGNGTFATGKYTLSYDAGKTVTGTGTAMTMSAAPTFTVAVGDTLRVGTQAKKITVVASQTSYTIESAFTTNPATSACTVSQTVYTLDLNNAAVDGIALSTKLTDSIADTLVLYNDTSSGTIYNPTDPALVAFIASSDGTNYTAVSAREADYSLTAPVTNLPTSGTNLFLRFFASATSGSGTVILAAYKAFFHRISGSESGGILNQAACFSNSVGTPVGCTAPTVVGGKTQMNLSFSFPVNVNSGKLNGALLVYINGVKVPRSNGTTLTPDGSYTEINANTIQLDRDYSSFNYLIEVYQAVSVVDSSTTNTTTLSALYNAIVGTGGNFTSLASALAAFPNGRILVLPSYTTTEAISVSGTPLLEGYGSTSAIAGNITISGNYGTLRSLRFGGNLTLSGSGNFVQQCFAAVSSVISDTGVNMKQIVVGT